MAETRRKLTTTGRASQDDVVGVYETAASTTGRALRTS